jgi:hypothetical protein
MTSGFAEKPEVSSTATCTTVRDAGRPMAVDEMTTPRCRNTPLLAVSLSDQG